MLVVSALVDQALGPCPKCGGLLSAHSSEIECPGVAAGDGESFGAIFGGSRGVERKQSGRSVGFAPVGKRREDV